jgi:cytochrome c553
MTKRLSFLLVSYSFFALATQHIFAADLEAGKKLFEGRCVECHGVDALGIEAQEAPKLAGQHDWYIVTQLKAFQKLERKNPKMLPFIQDLSEAQMNDLAAYIKQFKAQ